MEFTANSPVPYIQNWILSYDFAEWYRSVLSGTTKHLRDLVFRTVLLWNFQFMSNHFSMTLQSRSNQHVIKLSSGEYYCLWR